MDDVQMFKTGAGRDSRGRAGDHGHGYDQHFQSTGCGSARRRLSRRTPGRAGYAGAAPGGGARPQQRGGPAARQQALAHAALQRPLRHQHHRARGRGVGQRVYGRHRGRRRGSRHHRRWVDPRARRQQHERRVRRLLGRAAGAPAGRRGAGRGRPGDRSRRRDREGAGGPVPGSRVPRRQGGLALSGDPRRHRGLRHHRGAHRHAPANRRDRLLLRQNNSLRQVPTHLVQGTRHRPHRKDDACLRRPPGVGAHVPGTSSASVHGGSHRHRRHPGRSSLQALQVPGALLQPLRGRAGGAGPELHGDQTGDRGRAGRAQGRRPRAAHRGGPVPDRQRLRARARRTPGEGHGASPSGRLRRTRPLCRAQPLRRLQRRRPYVRIRHPRPDLRPRRHLHRRPVRQLRPGSSTQRGAEDRAPGQGRRACMHWPPWTCAAPRRSTACRRPRRRNGIWNPSSGIRP